MFLEGAGLGTDPVADLLKDPRKADQVAQEQAANYTGTGASKDEIVKRDYCGAALPAGPGTGGDEAGAAGDATASAHEAGLFGAWLQRQLRPPHDACQLTYTPYLPATWVIVMSAGAQPVAPTLCDFKKSR